MHDFDHIMGHVALPMNHNAAVLVMNKQLHGFATRFSVWRRLVESAIEKSGVWLTETDESFADLHKYLRGRELQIMTPYEYADSVNRNKVVFCPVRPTKLRPVILDALLDADELHFIRSHDHAQKRFSKEVGQRVAARGSPCKTITYRDGG